MRQIVFAATDVDHSILEKMVSVQRIRQQFATDGLQIRLGIDVDIVSIREHSGIGHTNNLHIVGVNHIVGHIVFRAHAVELQRVLTGNQRYELGGITMNRQQFFVGGSRRVCAKTLNRVVDMQTVGGHIPLGFLQRTDVMVHREVEFTGLVQIVIFHLGGVEVHVGAVVTCRESHA